MPALSGQHSKQSTPDSSASHLLQLSVRTALPFRGPRQVNDGETNNVSSNTRLVFTTVSLLCVLLLAIMFGSRAHALFDRVNLRKMAFIRVLLYLLYICATVFVFTASILESGLDLRTLSSCRVAIYVCLVFYVGCKVLVQLFLTERAHAARYMLKQRREDWLWIISVAVIVFGFGTIAVIGFIYPFAELATSNRACKIGLSFRVTIPLLTYDILINAALTGIFIALLRPLLRMRDPNQAQATFATPRPRIHPGTNGNEDSVHEIQTHHSEIELVSRPVRVVFDPNVNALKRLVRRSLIGAVLVLIPTTINLALLFKFRGEEQGWLCLTICTVDATWSVGVVHLLTVNTKEDRGVQLSDRPSVAGYFRHG